LLEDVTNPGEPFSSQNTSTGGMETVGVIHILEATEHLPETIGSYRIVRLLGQGGMGAVYEAEQESPRRTVALKVIRAGYATGEMLRRFENEAEALGRLHHPGIAQIYEAGMADTPIGRQPYFAMEMVDGATLLIWCTAHHLGMRERLELFAKICDAVQHAHQRGLIHRDLKPANILVDESGQPRILDFGVARLTDSDAQATRQTDLGQLIGTLAYMSPEQVLGDPDEIDTRSDVYALGVILYEMLAGKGPYAVGRQLHEAVRIIREEEPAQLSSINRTYRGDVETIVAKALEKDKTRRYASAAELAADVRRHLNDEPIVARPPSTTYQVQKFARRNKPLVIGVAVVFLVLVVGIIVSVREAIRARRAEATAQAVNDFLQKDLLGQASAYHQSKADPDIKVRTVLDRAAASIQGKFHKQPEVESAIRATVGDTYRELGIYGESRKQLELALQLQRKVFGPGDPRTIATMLRLTRTEEAQGKYADADALGNQTLEASKRYLGAKHLSTLQTMNQLVSIYDYEGKYAQGEALGTQAVALGRSTLGPDSPDTLSAMYFLAIIFYDQGKYAQAESLGSQTLEAQRRVLGPDNPQTLGSMNNLAATYGEEGNIAQALALDKQMFETRTRVLGPEHPDTMDSLVNLAHDYRDQANYAGAESLDKQALEIQRRVLGPEHPLTLSSMHNLASDLLMQGNVEQAATFDRQTLEIRRRVLGPNHPDTLWSMNSLAGDDRAMGKYELAEAFDKQALEGRRKLGPSAPTTIGSMVHLAIDEEHLGKYPQAEALLRKSLELRPNSSETLNALAYFLLSAKDRHLRRPDEALQLSSRAVKLAPETSAYMSTLAWAQISNGRWDDALATLNKHAIMLKGPDIASYFLMAMAHAGRGDRSEAERDFKAGADGAGKVRVIDGDSDLKIIWAQAAEQLGKPGPG
jgi:eukaryotic-like serine/threonine-protein kinase